MEQSKSITPINMHFLSDIKKIIQSARTKAYTAINAAMTESYWLMGKRIVEEEQNGKERADYGAQLIKTLSDELNREYGKGFSVTNLQLYRQFYLQYPDTEKYYSLSNKLTWTHIRRIMRITNPEARAWYLKESTEQMWSVRTLDRNINTQYYERLLMSQHKNVVIKEMEDKTKAFQLDKLEFIKNPVVAEFLGLSPNSDISETKLETSIISNLQKFMMELGKGFAFVARQQSIRTEAEIYFIDLVFYNYILKCFVLFDLKIGKITHQDVGQMDMYVRMYDELKRNEGDNPTIGIVLCSETDADIARYSVLKGSEQLFATKYKLFLPTEEELRTEIERQKLIFKMQQAGGVNNNQKNIYCQEELQTEATIRKFRIVALQTMHHNLKQELRQ